MPDVESSPCDMICFSKRWKEVKLVCKTRHAVRPNILRSVTSAEAQALVLVVRQTTHFRECWSCVCTFLSYSDTPSRSSLVSFYSSEFIRRKLNNPQTSVNVLTSTP